ncbi:uncharacterized protein LOC122565549 [Chiloscyllium plagiosum]|uniref:uncharacterized protein LOC122565549 n=1 Tax=Chiloscyllium plagiosum TaxID=36176 RepID=UPI001CB7B14E|nr:uncharacterized protein LOC122565549 [Chiloscyllium plagiosum]
MCPRCGFIYKSGNNKLTAAVFVEEHVVMLIGNSVFSYHPKQKSWILAEGIKLDVDGISSYQCCISQEPFCKAVSSVVIAYRANIVMPEITIFLSNDGGYHFKEMRPIMQAEGIFQGAIIQPSVSTLSLLIKVDKKFHFRHFSVYGNLTSSDFVLNFDDSEATIIQPPGLKGHVVIWSQHSLLFSPNHGQNVYPIMVDGTTGRLNPLLNKHQNIHQVVINYESEIAILTSDGEIYFGILNMDALIVKAISNMPEALEECMVSTSKSVLILMFVLGIEHN